MAQICNDPGINSAVEYGIRGSGSAGTGGNTHGVVEMGGVMNAFVSTEQRYALFIAACCMTQGEGNAAGGKTFKLLNGELFR